jgi:D-alanine-D-alanine ligase
MKRITRPYRVVVVYNAVEENPDGDDDDLISEGAVKQESQAVYQALLDKGHQAICVALENIATDLTAITKIKPDLIFNLSEGYLGKAVNEMHVAAIWELLEIPYTGNAPLTLGLAQNKIITKHLLQAHQLPTPEFQVYHNIPENTYLTFPLIAKPSAEDSSLGITQDSVIDNFEQLQIRVKTLIDKYNQPILVEQLIEGREFNVAIMGDNPARPLPVSEINFQQLENGFHAITSYEAKWLKNHPLYYSTPAVCPADITPELEQKLNHIALQVYKLLAGRDYGRIDFRMDDQENIYVLEYNPNPDISSDAGYANALRAAGIEYSDFIDFLLEQAINRIDHDSYTYYD